FKIPAGVGPGTYGLRLFDQFFNGRLATSSPLTVIACTTATLSASPTTFYAGDTITVTWSGVCVPNGQNRVGLYTPGAPDGNYTPWQNSGGAARASVFFKIPAGVGPGTYELRLFTEFFNGRIATSSAMTAIACTTATLSASPD